MEMPSLMRQILERKESFTVDQGHVKPSIKGLSATCPICETEAHVYTEIANGDSEIDLRVSRDYYQELILTYKCVGCNNRITIDLGHVRKSQHTSYPGLRVIDRRP